MKMFLKLSFALFLCALMATQMMPTAAVTKRSVLALPSGRIPKFDFDKLPMDNGEGSVPAGLYWCLSICSSQWIGRCSNARSNYNIFRSGNEQASNCQQKFRTCSDECRQAYDKAYDPEIFIAV